MAAAIGTDRAKGDLLEIVEAGDFSRLRPDDFKDLVPMRDHYSRQVDQLAAAENQVRRVEQLREEQVTRHVSEGTFGLLAIGDLRFSCDFARRTSGSTRRRRRPSSVAPLATPRLTTLIPSATT